MNTREIRHKNRTSAGIAFGSIKSDKMDYTQAALAVLEECEAIQKYYEIEEGITPENLMSFLNKEIDGVPAVYDVCTSGIGIVIERNGELVTGEEAFRLMSDSEKQLTGERRFIGAKGRYIVPAGAKAAKISKMLEKANDFSDSIKNDFDEDVRT